MKKNLCIILVTAILFSLFVPVTGVLANSYVGTAVKSDTIAYINNYPIPSYNLNGYTFIQVEDLAYYGFDIKWNEYNKTLRIIRNDSPYIDFIPTFRPAEWEIGQTEFDMHTTNVRTYIGNYGYEIECYSGLPGCTYINIENIAVFGEIQYVPELKHVKIWIKNLECYDIPYPVRISPFTMTDFGHDAPYGYEGEYYYTMDYYSDSDNYYFTYGRFTEEYGEVTGYAYCDYGTIYVDIYDTEGRKIYTNSEYKRSEYYYGEETTDLTVVPYILGETDAPVSYEIAVPSYYLKNGHDYMARVTFWCDYYDEGDVEDIYFTCWK